MNQIDYSNAAARLPLIFLLLMSSNAFAMLGSTSSDTTSILSTTGFSVACLVVVLLGGIILRRVGKRKRSDISGATGLNLMELRKRGLLTPEELTKVSGAIARQMAEKDAARQKLLVAPPAEALLDDPEVRRLEALALATKHEEFPNSQKPMLNDETIANSEVGQPHISTPASAPPELVASTEESLDAIVLPPDVQQLADAGILTPEEIINVKRRMKARRESGQ